MSEPVARRAPGVVRTASPRVYREGFRHPGKSDFLIRIVIRPSYRNLQAYLHDISSTGIGLLFNRPLRRGSRLAILLRREKHKMCPILTAKVAHSTRHKDDCWLVGCSFSRPLLEAELEPLLED
jgi:hypothetical protein